MRTLIASLFTTGCFVGPSGGSTAPIANGGVTVTAELTELPPVSTDNSRAIILARHVTVRASSEYGGWPATNAVDGDPKTSWYSAANDSAAHGTVPFIEVVLDQPSVVRRVTILGNRDPAYLRGYTVSRGRLEVFDASGRVLTSRPSNGTGNRRDFDFLIDPPVNEAVVVRFTSLVDEGDRNNFGDIAIAEVQID